MAVVHVCAVLGVGSWQGVWAASYLVDHPHPEVLQHNPVVLALDVLDERRLASHRKVCVLNPVVCGGQERHGPAVEEFVPVVTGRVRPSEDFAL